MSETPAELEPLPAAMVTTIAAVKGQANIPLDDSTEDARLELIVDAVDDVIRDLPVADRDRGKDDWSARVTLGAAMLGGRLYRRKDSPAGVAAFGADGPVYIQRNDPDIAQLLQLGDYALPAVG